MLTVDEVMAQANTAAECDADLIYELTVKLREALEALCQARRDMEHTAAHLREYKRLEYPLLTLDSAIQRAAAIFEADR